MESPSRVALVTGGSGGIGRAACVALARKGHSVAVHYRSDRASAEDVARAIKRESGDATTVQADLANRAEVSKMMGEVEKFAGPRGLGLLFNNAGIYPSRELDMIDQADWDRVMAINVRGPFFCVQEALPLLKAAGWARVINIGSNAVFRGTRGMLHYVTSRSAMNGFTRALARELAPFSVTVNCIVPSVVLTPTAREMYTAEESAALVAQQAVPRPQTPEDLAGTLLFLASEGSAFITGQTIMVDGGRLGG